jgi:hypothetical protein
LYGFDKWFVQASSLHFSGVLSSSQSLQVCHQCHHPEASKAYSVPEAVIDNSLISKKFY